MASYREIKDFRTYAPHPFTPRAFLVDIDGTLSLRCDRNPYDTSKVSQDTPNPGVVTAVQTLIAGGLMPIFMSGRSWACVDDTHDWLVAHVVWGQWEVFADGLYMRKEGDYRPDYVVKYELFWDFIAPKWNVQFVLDDRNQVVDMWRAMGLTCMQVAPGDF